MERNEISQIAREYKNAGFAGRQKELEDQKVKFQDSKVQGLMKEQREFILSRMPNFFESMANEESRSVFEHYSTNGDDNGRVTTEGRGHSEILNSFAFQHQQQRVNDAKKQLEIFQSPEFQLDILATLPSNDSGSRELLQKLFRQEQLTEGEHLKLNPILESAVKRFYRSEKK